MQAHIVPVAYLKAFAQRRGKPKHWKAWKISPSLVAYTAIGELCTVKDYYTSDSDADAKLFKEQEALLGTLLAQLSSAGVETALAAKIPSCVWLLKLRNRCILENTGYSYREVVLQAGRLVELADYDCRLLQVNDNADALVTSDNPVVMIGYGQLDEQAMILPLSPTRLLICAPRRYFRFVGGSVSSRDSSVLNFWQASQAGMYIIARERPREPSIYQAAISSHEIRMARSSVVYSSGLSLPQSRAMAQDRIYVVNGPPQKAVIVNYYGRLLGGPNGSLSFLACT